MSVKEVNLFWEGVWEIGEGQVPYDIPDDKGIYVILTGKREILLKRWKVFDQIIDVGCFRNLRRGLQTEGKWDAWQEHNQKKLLVKVAVGNPGAKLEQVVQGLISGTKPLCQKVVEEEDTEKSLDILLLKNRGKSWPLAETYDWQVADSKREAIESEKKEDNKGLLGHLDPNK